MKKLSLVDFFNRCWIDAYLRTRVDDERPIQISVLRLDGHVTLQIHDRTNRSRSYIDLSLSGARELIDQLGERI